MGNRIIEELIRNAILVILQWVSIVFPVSDVFLCFMDSTVVNNETVFLEDIALIECQSDNSICRALAKTKIGNAAPAGYSRYMNTKDIINNIVIPRFHNLRIKQNSVKRVKIRTDAQKQCVKDFKKQILEYLNTNVKWNRSDYNVTITNQSKNWYVYRRPVSVYVDGLSSPYPKGSLRLTLKISQNKLTITVPVLCKIQVISPIVIVSKTIPRNHIITPDYIEIKKNDITSFRYAPFTDISSATGKIAVKTLSPGTIIHDGYVKMQPEVCKGDKVYIKLQKGQIKVSVPAKAREEGVVGDRIWVENIKSHKLVRVKIAGNGIVHVIEGESI